MKTLDRYVIREILPPLGLALGVFTFLLAIQPTLGLAHQRLGMIDLEEGHPREALREFDHERLLGGDRPGVALLIGSAWRRLGNTSRARDWYRRELKVDPGSATAAESLSALDRRPTP